ncbi:protein SYM1 [Malania oleifera]|uniref:protein SYM1 n=1 Tax=Malania oleifera TaxID=397392 RepID=UPI0025ADE901|nr:protein SYM1 [Malania oleifera]XP_057954621.1 protein SYM1 [Malania oleifera]
MDALGGCGGSHGGWWWSWRRRRPRPFRSQQRQSKASGSVEAAGNDGHRFPFKQALTAGSLALTGDTIAQLRERWMRRNSSPKIDSLSHSDDSVNKDVMSTLLSNHDWLRALRMASYGFLFYGPGSYVWYQYLDRSLPAQTVENLLLKVLLNQIVLGPSVIAVVFAWNNLWQGKLSQLPNKYQKDALPTLLYGFRFWIPVSALNFWVVPLQARVAFMSMGSIFWNFFLSSTMSK